VPPAKLWLVTIDYELMATTIETLTLIWQRVLMRSAIGTEESFFDLGGDEALADLLFAEISRVYGRHLPSAMIGRAPTIATQVALVEHPTLPRFSPFLQIKAGSEKPPILIAHGLSGNVEFFKLAKHIRTENPIYGIRAKGIDGTQEPFQCVEDMAAFYLESLAEQYPDGPYVLFGYSFGGLVALEMAQRLSERVALLVLLDTYPHPRYLPRDHRMRLFGQRVRHHVHAMRQLPLPSAFSYFAHGFKYKLQLAGALNDSGHTPEMPNLSCSQATQWVNERAYHAYRNYRPRFYRGKINLVTAEKQSFFPGDPATVWGHLAGELEVERIPGNHLNIVTTEFEGLASVLTRYIQEVTPQHIG
jgi:acetoacetyl-CoA synthetase